MATMQKPANVEDALWDYVQSYVRGGASVIDPFDETYVVEQQFIKHRVDLDSAKTSYTFFRNTAKSDFVCDLEQGRIDQSKVAILHAPVVRVTQGRTAAGVARTKRILANQTNVAGTQADAQTMADAWAEARAIDEFLNLGFITAAVGKRPLLTKQSGLTRFPFPGGTQFDGPGFGFNGTFPATTGQQLGAAIVNNGLQHVNNVFNQVPNAILAGTLDLSMTIELQGALTVPAGAGLVAEVGYLATVISPWRNS